MDANPNWNTYDVQYTDGEEDLGLCQTCVRPFKPYAVNELVEARINSSENYYFKAIVVHRNEKEDWYDVRFTDQTPLANKQYVLSSSLLRRFR